MLLIGPPKSGKTRRVLDSVQAAIQAGRSDETLLLVPTPGMKHHLLYVLTSRRGLVVPEQVILTMSEFVRSLTPGVREATGAIEARLLRQALRRVSPEAFGPQPDAAGLRARVGALIREFWAAGADSLQLEPAARSRGQRAFLDVFREHERCLRALGLVHHNQRIALAAARVREEGLGRVRQVLVDGFDWLTRQQEALLDALAEQAEEIAIALPEGVRQPQLRRLRTVILPPPPDAGPATEVVQAATPRAEIVEVARRILASGRPLNDHAIIVRSPEAYEPVVREVFETLQIPYRNWGNRDLARHGVVRHFIGWLRAIERDFPGEETAELLASPLSPLGSARDRDAMDFEVRRLLPGSGLEFFRDAARGFPGPSGCLAALSKAAAFPRHRYGAPRWSREILKLQEQLQRLAPPVTPGQFQRTCDWREALAAQKALRRAIEDTAELPEFTRRLVRFADFTEALEDVLRHARLAVRDRRLEVVHLLSAHEARQWSLPVAFVCGLADEWFPSRLGQDLLFDDEDRAQLRARGIAIRRTADKAAEEQFLFQVAATRASDERTLSYPQLDSQGRPLARSGVLGDFPEPAEAPRARPGDIAPPCAPTHSGTLRADLLGAVAARNETFSVSGIQEFRQCPYLYFSGKTLQLRSRPALPERRLDGAVVGSVAHATLERWNSGEGPIGEVLDRVFAETLASLRLPQSFRTDRLRLSLRSDLVRFAREQGASIRVPDGQQARFEDVRTYHMVELESRPEVQCRIDRFDLDDDRRCVVTDYKYARPSRVRELLKGHLDGDELQLMIYLAALEQAIGCEPTGIALCGMRGQTTYMGIAVDGAGGLQSVDTEGLRAMLERARSEAAGAVTGILDGDIAVMPKRPSYCEDLCKYRSVCRVQWNRRGADGGQPGRVPS